MKNSEVRPKKHLGQHFLNDENIAKKIVNALSIESTNNVLEIGPGTGVLSRFILENQDWNYKAIELDSESIVFLKSKFPEYKDAFIQGDFLKMDLLSLFKGEPFVIIGNFPYNISSQILFKILDNQELIPEMTGMFQKEVAERVAIGPGSKTYGAISAMLQSSYRIDYLFTVSENVFTPPPKVKSAVIKMVREIQYPKDFDFRFFKVVVKTAFGQRRKTLRNSLKQLLVGKNVSEILLSERPERLSVLDFIQLSIQLK